MKKSLMFTIVVALVIVLAMPALAQRGFGRQQGHMGPGYGGPQQGTDSETARVCQEAWNAQMKGTEPLQREILIKRHEMGALLANQETKLDVLLKKQGELQKLNNELENKDLAFKWNFYKEHPDISPDMYRGCFGPGAGGGGRGFRGAGGGYGFGPGMMGPGGGQSYGPGMIGPGGGQSYGPGMMEPGRGQNY